MSLSLSFREAGAMRTAQRNSLGRRPTWPALVLVWLQVGTAAAAEDRLGRVAEQLLSGNEPADPELVLEQFSLATDPRVEGVLLRLLESKSVALRAAAAGVLWRYPTGEALKRLEERLLDGSGWVRVEAAKSLCLAGKLEALKVIGDALAGADADSRRGALRALALIERPEARKLLEGFRPTSGSEDAIWHAYACCRLGMEPEKNRKLIGAVLEDTRLAVAAKLLDPTADDLRKIAAPSPQQLRLKLASARALSDLGDAESLLLLARGAADPGWRDSPQRPAVLLRRHGKAAAAAIARCLADERALVRLGCADAAGGLRTEDVDEELISALAARFEDGARLVRLKAMRSARALGGKQAAQALVKLLEHADEKTREAAARELGRTGLPAAAMPLLGRLADERSALVRRQLYRALERLGSSQTVEPLLERLKLLLTESRQNSRVAEEIPLCIRALGGGGDATARRLLAALPSARGKMRSSLIEALALSGSPLALEHFLDQLREQPPHPEAAVVRYFDSLKVEQADRLESIIREETAMWIRVILARTLLKLGRREYARGLVWGLQQDDAYLNRLAAALAAGVQLPQARALLARLLRSEPDTARYAARALIGDGSPEAVGMVVSHLDSPALRELPALPLKPFWERASTPRHPYAKDIDGERVWVLFADDRLGRHMDLFLVWSQDGQVWNEPVFTGLTSFSDAEGQVPPPTFSLKARGRDITIALTRTFAEGTSTADPRFKTVQRVNTYKLQDFFRDRDSDGLVDQTEEAIFTSPARADSDGDGLPDRQDKNPLSAPADDRNDAELVKVLAFARAAFFSDALRTRGRLLVIRTGLERVPELPWFPYLVLHLSPQQVQALWKVTGAGYPHFIFEATRFSEGGRRALQRLRRIEANGDETALEFRFEKQDGQWVSAGHRS